MYDFTLVVLCPLCNAFLLKTIKLVVATFLQKHAALIHAQVYDNNAALIHAQVYDNNILWSLSYIFYKDTSTKILLSY